MIAPCSPIPHPPRPSPPRCRRRSARRCFPGTYVRNSCAMSLTYVRACVRTYVRSSQKAASCVPGVPVAPGRVRTSYVRTYVRRELSHVRTYVSMYVYVRAHMAAHVRCMHPAMETLRSPHDAGPPMDTAMQSAFFAHDGVAHRHPLRTYVTRFQENSQMPWSLPQCS